MINYNESKYDLPLQRREALGSLSNIARTDSKDLPRQLSKDLFRQEYTQNKENRPLGQADQNIKASLNLNNSSKKKITMQKTTEKMDQKVMLRDRSDHLRDIIRKQLFCHGKEDLVKMESRKNIINSEANQKPKEEKRQDRYKKLLSEFYGDPTKYSNKINRQNKREKSSNNPTPNISRHQSMKKLGQPLQRPQQEALKRNHSNCSLKPSSFLRQKPSLPKQPSYLELYWQRRSPQLSL